MNTGTDRAKRLIGWVIEDLKDKYTIIHATNVESSLSVFFASSYRFLCSPWTDTCFETVQIGKPDILEGRIHSAHQNPFAACYVLKHHMES